MPERTDKERISALETAMQALALDGRETSAWRHEVIRILEGIRLGQEGSNKLHEAAIAKDAAHDNRLTDHDRQIAEVWSHIKTQEAVKSGQIKVVAGFASLCGGLAGTASPLILKLFEHGK